MADALAEKLLRREERARARAGTFRATWQEIRRYMQPNASSFYGLDARGQRNRVEILDNTAELAGEELASAILGHIAPSGTQWVRETAGAELDDDYAVAVAIEERARRLFTVFEAAESQFYMTLAEFETDLVYFGTGDIFVRDRPGRVPLYENVPLAELSLEEDGDLRATIIYRRWCLTATQADERWPGRAGENVTKAIAKDRGDDSFEFLQCVYRRTERQAGRRDGANKAWASVWINIDAKRVIDQQGYDELRHIVGRWKRKAGDVYGRGPGAMALQEVKGLQRGMRIQFRGAEKVMDPPLLSPDDGMLGRVDLRPGAVNRYRSELLGARRAPLEPLVTGSRPDMGHDFMESRRQAVRMLFLAHLLQINADPRMTATHVLRLTRDQRRVLIPIWGRQMVEVLSPLVETTLAILERQGALPPLPEAQLRGRKLGLLHTSPAAQLMELEDAEAIGTFTDLVMPWMDRDPGLRHEINGGVMLRKVAKGLRVPMTALNSPERAAELRAQEQQQIAAAAEAQQAQQAAAAFQSVGQGVAALRGPEAGRAA